MQIYSLLRTGISHEKRGIPCQDHLEYKQCENGTWIMALSDGAGSAKHAKEAAKANVVAMIKFFEQYELEEVLSWEEEEQKEKILNACFFELRECAKEIGDLKIKDYCATLLFAAIGKKEMLVGHIGDGAIYAIDEKGRCIYTSGPDNGNSSRHTYFTVSKDRMDHFFLKKIAMQDAEQEKVPSAIIFMSDGPYTMFQDRGEGEPTKTVEEIAPFLLEKQIASDEEFEALLNQMTELELEKMDDWSLIAATELTSSGE